MIHRQHSSDRDHDDDDHGEDAASDHETHRHRRRKLCHHASLSHLRSNSGYDHHTLPAQHGHSHHSHSHSGKSATTGRKSSTGSHHHHHHHYHHRRHRIHHHDHHRGTPRKNRSHTDVSNTSVNTCHELCPDQEVREILIQRPCCSSSKTEIVQYFIEDLYGPSGRISCCTSSDYCYHTDSTSLYGSRSSLSRNGSVKSGSATIRRKRSVHHRQVPYSSASLGKLNRSNPNSIDGSLTSIFNKPRDTAGSGGSGGKIVVSPSKITVENPKKDSSKRPVKCTNNECSYTRTSSPIRWSFLADNESKTPSDDVGRGVATAVTSQDESDSMRKYTDYSEESHESRSSTLSRTESNTVVFHQEGEAANNCCNNYIQYNAYLDQDLQITSEDICGYLSLSKDKEGEVLNNSVNYPFQPTNALEFQYRKNFHVSNSNSPELNYHNQQRQQRLNSKETNINQNIGESMPLSPTNINLSSSSNNINIIFNSYADNSAAEVKFINTTRESTANVEGQQSSFIHQHSYPSYDYNNMSTNSLFDKPLGIDEIPSSSSNARTSTATTPENFFETTSSHQNLLYYRQSSFREGNSTTSSFTNANYNNTAAVASFEASNNLQEHQQSDQQFGNYSQHGHGDPPARPFHQNYPHQSQQQFHQQHPYHHHHRHCTSTSHRWQHVSENFKIGNALKLVRKRARKCAQYLRKK